MANDARLIGASLLETGTLVTFRILEEDVVTAHDEAEFGMRVSLKFVPQIILRKMNSTSRISLRA